MKRTQMTITYPGGHQEIEYIDHADPGGLFGPFLRRRREERVRKAQAQRDSRLLQLSRDIKALEAWHHAWRLEWDADYRELHPGEWCSLHRKVFGQHHCARGRYRQSIDVGPYEVTTWSGHVIRGPRPAQLTTPSLTTEERRAATRTMAKWGRDG
ncbi:hypothetical protein B5180_01550 [Streptomyces sp. BF-3]|nr:hypothetical protein B5180_01550 [Streptomyces sp. BF-3]